MMTWAPFSIVGEEIQKLSGDRPHSGQYEPLMTEFDLEEDSDAVELNVGRISISSSVPPFSTEELEVIATAEAGDKVSTSELSGV